MSKKHQKDSHFIPSPLPVVTQYENEFVRGWNENMAKAVGEILKYIANQTSQAIKNKDKLKEMLL